MARNRKTLLLILLYVVIIAVGGFTFNRVRTVNHAMNGLYDVSLGQFQGAADAEKVIIEFLDYRCSHCRTIHAVVQDVIAQNPDVKVIYRHYPVFRRPSVIEAEVALAAGMQGKFSEAHEVLISRETPITDREIEALAQSLDLDMERFRFDMKGPEIGRLLLNTLDTVKILGIKGTPTFVVGNVIYSLKSGMPTVETFEELLEQAYGE